MSLTHKKWMPNEWALWFLQWAPTIHSGKPSPSFASHLTHRGISIATAKVLHFLSGCKFSRFGELAKMPPKSRGAIQNLCFCLPKPMLLGGKSYAFANMKGSVCMHTRPPTIIINWKQTSIHYIEPLRWYALTFWHPVLRRTYRYYHRSLTSLREYYIVIDPLVIFLKFPTPVFIMFQSNNGCCNPSVFRRFLFVKNTLIPALLLIQVLPRLGVC